MIDVLTFRGAGEIRRPGGMPSGMTGAVAQKLNSRFASYEIDWPAQIGPLVGGPKAVSLETSVDVGVTKGIQHIRDSPYRVGLIGYSLGAIVTSRIMEIILKNNLRNSDGTRLEVPFVVNIANPLRREGVSELPLNLQRGYGIYGRGKAWPAGTVCIELADRDDVICCADEDSPIRRISDVISPFSFLEGANLGDVSLQLAMMRGREQMWQFWNPAFRRRYETAFRDAAGYLLPPPRGRHTHYAAEVMPGKDVTWTDYAVNKLNEKWG